jgi:hypothetical protein
VFHSLSVKKTYLPILLGKDAIFPFPRALNCLSANHSFHKFAIDICAIHN